MNRCAWAGTDPLTIRYHDEEWGRPLHDDQRLFEFLVLEGAQAGLSFRTILHKRENYRRAYEGFDVARVAAFGPEQEAALLMNPGIVRNRRKIASSIQNARCFLRVQAEFGSFSRYLWAFVDFSPVVGRYDSPGEVPCETELSRRISRDLKKRGFSFVGPTIVYAYLQAVGVVEDHEKGCFCKPPG